MRFLKNILFKLCREETDDFSTFTQLLQNYSYDNRDIDKWLKKMFLIFFDQSFSRLSKREKGRFIDKKGLKAKKVIDIVHMVDNDNYFPITTYKKEEPLDAIKIKRHVHHPLSDIHQDMVYLDLFFIRKQLNNKVKIEKVPIRVSMVVEHYSKNTRVFDTIHPIDLDKYKDTEDYDKLINFFDKRQGNEIMLKERTIGFVNFGIELKNINVALHTPTNTKYDNYQRSTYAQKLYNLKDFSWFTEYHTDYHRYVFSHITDKQFSNILKEFDDYSFSKQIENFYSLFKQIISLEDLIFLQK